MNGDQDWPYKPLEKKIRGPNDIEIARRLSVPNPRGVTGPEGRRGREGPYGPQGVRGDQGVIGRDGIRGNDGPQGPQGIVGPQGPPGQALPPLPCPWTLVTRSPGWSGELHARHAIDVVSAELDGSVAGSLGANVQGQIGNLVLHYWPVAPKHFIIAAESSDGADTWATLSILIDGRLLVRAPAALGSVFIHVCFPRTGYVPEEAAVSEHTGSVPQNSVEQKPPKP